MVVRAIRLALCAILALPLLASAQEQPKFQLLAPFGGGGLGGGNENLVTFTGEYRVSPQSREGLLTVKAKIESGWHIYSTTQKPGGAMASKLKLAPTAEFELRRPFVADRAPHIKPPDVFPVPSEEFLDEVVWSAPIQVAPTAPVESLKFDLKFDGQACQDEGSCVPLMGVPIAVKYAGEYTSPARGTYKNPRAHATLRGEVAPRTVVPGGKVRLTLTAEPAAEYHVYAWADRDPGVVTKPTLIAWQQSHDWAPGAPQPSAPPVAHPTGLAEKPIDYYYEQPVSWTVEFTVPANAAEAGYELKGAIGYQTCKGGACDPPAGAEFSAIVAVSKPGAAGDTAAEPLEFRPGSYTTIAKLAAAAASLPSPPAPSSATVPETVKIAPPPESAPAQDVANYQGPLLEVPRIQPVGGVDETQSMLVMLPTALLAGFILNFMPCVLPVIGLKIVSFVHQAGHSRSRIFMLNLWYSLGILLVFMVLASFAVFAGVGWGTQFQSATFNIVLTCVVFAFALSFLGIWEIPLPGIVGATGANKVGEQEGPLGAVLKGMLTTVLATPCSGPLLVPALAWALKQPPVVTYTVFVCVGIGMAAPYLLVGAFPRLISFLPKPGEWMEAFKQVMGFVLLGTVVYLITFIRQPLVVPTVAFMFGLWGALWFVGKVPVWSETSRLAAAWMGAFAFTAVVGLGIFSSWEYSLANIMNYRFRRDVSNAIGTPEFNVDQIAAQGAGGHGSSELPWKPYSLELLSKSLLVDKRPVFVDFTADWCPNCKTNEAVAFNVQDTKSYVESNGVITIKADWTDGDPRITEMLRQLGGSAIPYCAIFSPEDPYRPIVMDGLVTPGRLLEKFGQVVKQPSSLMAKSQ